MISFSVFFISSMLSFISIFTSVSTTTIDWQKCRDENQFCFGISHYTNKTSFDGDSGCLARYDCTVFIVGNKNSTSGEFVLTYAYNFMMIENLVFHLTFAPSVNITSGNVTRLEATFKKESLMARFVHYIKMSSSGSIYETGIPPSTMKLNNRFIFFKYETLDEKLLGLTITDVKCDLMVHLDGTSSANRKIDVLISEPGVVIFGQNKMVEEESVKITEHSELPWWSVIILLVVGVSIASAIIYLIDSTNEKGKSLIKALPLIVFLIAAYKAKSPARSPGEIRSEESIIKMSSEDPSFVSKSESSGRLKPLKV